MRGQRCMQHEHASLLHSAHTAWLQCIAIYSACTNLPLQQQAACVGRAQACNQSTAGSGSMLVCPQHEAAKVQAALDCWCSCCALWQCSAGCGAGLLLAGSLQHVAWAVLVLRMESSAHQLRGIRWCWRCNRCKLGQRKPVWPLLRCPRPRGDLGMTVTDN